MEHKGTAVLETDRLILRPFKEEDAEDAYRNWCSDPEVTRFTTWTPHGDIDVTRRIIGFWLEQYSSPDYYQWAIELKETGEVIGTISVVALNENTGAAEIGYCISKKHWGRGIATEAMKAAVAYLFEKTGAECVYARHNVKNAASGAVMLKCGLRYDGLIRGDYCDNDGPCDLSRYSITRKEYFDMKNTGGFKRREYECAYSTGVKQFRMRAAGVIIEDGCVLFIGNPSDDYLYSVGGAVRLGETAEHAAEREVFEETGIRYEIDRLAVIHECFFTVSGGTECHEVCFYFLMKPKGMKMEGTAAYNSFGEREDMHWIPIDELGKVRAFPAFLKDYVKEMPEGIRHIVEDERL